MHERRSRLSGSEPAEAASLIKQFQQQAQRVGTGLLGLLFPSTCVSCRRVDEILCATCRANFVPLEPPLCSLCGQPVTDEANLCGDCQRREPPYVAGHSVFRFEGTLRAAVHALKFGRRAEVATLLAEEMLSTLRRQRPECDAWPLDVALAVPLHPLREAARGYNQARLLVEPLAAAWGLPVMDDAVRRVRDTRTQLGLSAPERRENVHDAFEANTGRISGLNVLLVDDIRTTGATLEACSVALRLAGANTVRALTLAQAV